MPTQTTRHDLLDGIVVEFLHNSPRGRRLVAVGGVAAEVDGAFADDLAVALAEHGQPTARESVGGADEAALRAVVVEPFRSGVLDGATDPDTVLVVDGERLLVGDARGIWHFSVWVLRGDELPDSGANVIVDATDQAAPTRYFYDYCKLPPSLNRPGLH
ncbi:hypothetical protein [Agromyces sp. LHK192]|uniref:hypothetical protein n=1 Tax=Agromyces sp. LHK192 TaxID=2498704 RepID=UPI000FD83D85|nr:hypothetical protein [Agromyces sp. LHK192]